MRIKYGNWVPPVLAVVILAAGTSGCSDSPAVAVDRSGSTASDADDNDGTDAPAPADTGAQGAVSNPAQARRSGEDAVEASPVAASGGKPLNKTFDDLKFDIERDEPYEPSMIGDDVRKFLGKRIRIRGWIKPQAFSKLSSFILVRDNKECCFGPGAMLYDCIRVQLADGMTTQFTSVPIAVEGVLTLNEMKFGNKTWSVYYMVCDKVE